MAVHLFQCLGTQSALGLVVDSLERQIVLRLRDPHRVRKFRAPLWWLVGAITIVGCVVFFFSLRPSTQMWFLVWNAVGLAIYFLWSARNARLAKNPDQAA